eukprot:g3739.t1
MVWALAQQEIKDLQHEFQLEREDLLATIRSAAKEVKLKSLLMEEFIPLQSRQLLEQHSQWNEEEGIWAVEKIHLAGNNVVQNELLQRQRVYMESKYDMLGPQLVSMIADMV